MSLFEKIDMEPIEVEPDDKLPKSTRKFTDEKLTVAYLTGRKLLVSFYALCFLPFFFAFLEGDSVILQMWVFLGAVFLAWYLYACLVPRDVTFSPESIVVRGAFGSSILPTHALVFTVTEQSIKFYLGCEKNMRESVKINRYLITPENAADIVEYAKDVYQVIPHTWHMGEPASGNGGISKLALDAYRDAVDTYRVLSALLVISLLVVLFVAGVNDNFYGMAPTLPAFPTRMAVVCAAVAVFFLLRRLAPSAHPRTAGNNAVPVTLKFKDLNSKTSLSAFLASGVTILGVVLFLLFGNLLDFYLFLVVGGLFLYDFYPRLSAWEPVAAAKNADTPQPVLLPRRSLQVSLVLMGALSVASYGESPRYLYNSRQDCQQDWGDGKDCQETPGDGGSYGVRHYYGPRFGTGGGRAPHSVGVVSVSRGGFGSMGSFHASFGG